MRRRGARPPGVGAVGDEVLLARQVGVTLGGARLVDGVDLCVRRGELVALVGPNGAGKSTLLAALAGDVDHAGSVRVDGVEAASWSSVELAMRRSVMPQHHQMSFAFTVRQVVEMGRTPWRGTVWEHDHDAQVERSMREAEVDHLAERNAMTLSGGERARVAFARVLAQQAPLMLLDEPTAALDLRHQELVFGRVASHVAGGGAAVVVAHDLNLAAAHAHRVVVLSAGQVVTTGAPREVLTPVVLEPVYRQKLVMVADPVSGCQMVVPWRPQPQVAFHDKLS